MKALETLPGQISEDEFCCPLCEGSETERLTFSWKKFHDEKQFFLSRHEWFVQCRECGTIYRAPLKVYADFRNYGKDYYDQVNSGETVEEHALWHFENFQKPNYDALHRHMLKVVPPEKARKWLDVGSIGYATTLSRYDFRTIEPDPRIVKLGRRHFRKWFSFFNKPKIDCATLETHVSADKYDGILFNNSVYCLTTPLSSLLRASEMLRPGGHLLVTISTYFNDATAVRTDGLVSRIEDVLQGETLWVFYNKFSLEYLCRKAGFELESTAEVPCYGKKTMQVYHFKKTGLLKTDAELLHKSREHMTRKLENCFDGFDAQTKRALSLINNKSYFVIGTARVINEALIYGALDQTSGIVFFEPKGVEQVPLSGTSMTMIDVKRVLDASQKNIRFRAAVLSFKYQDEIHALIKSEWGERVDILMPNRKSGMEQLQFEFAGKTRPCKGLCYVSNA